MTGLAEGNDVLAHVVLVALPGMDVVGLKVFGRSTDKTLGVDKLTPFVPLALLKLVLLMVAVVGTLTPAIGWMVTFWVVLSKFTPGHL